MKSKILLVLCLLLSIAVVPISAEENETPQEEEVILTVPAPGDESDDVPDGPAVEEPEETQQDYSELINAVNNLSAYNSQLVTYELITLLFIVLIFILK